jgi:hypothetical protein
MMENASSAKPKLNIFALPNQTTIVFWIIVSVVLSSVLAGSIGTSPIRIWPLAVALLVLPLRAFLARPERESIKPPDDDLAGLQEEVQAYAARIGLPRTPRLVISPARRGPYTFGTFRYWYISVSEDEANAWLVKLRDPDTAPSARAKLIHELYHFKTGDYWQLGYAGELLRWTFTVMGWAAAFFVGLGTFLIMVKPELMTFNPTEMVAQMNAPEEMRELLLKLLPSEAAMEAIREKAAGTNLFRVILFAFAATWPFAIMGLLMLWDYLPKLWRTREFYADAGVVHTQKKMSSFHDALFQSPRDALFQPPPLETDKPKGILEKIVQVGRILRKFLSRIVSKIFKRLHPPMQERIDAVKDPSRVFDSLRSVAFRVAILALILEALLLTPITFLQVAQWPMHFPTLAVLVIVSLNFLIPAIAQGRDVFWDILKIVGVVVGLRLMLFLLMIVMLTTLLISAPEQLSQMLEDAIAAVSGYAGTEEGFGYDDLNAFVVKVAVINLAQVVIVAFVLVGGLAGVTFLLRRIFTWYGFPQAEGRLMKVAYLTLGLVSLFVGLALLPLITNALLRPNEIFTWLNLILAFFGFTVAFFGLARFIRLERRYANRCSQCDGSVAKPYELGRRCQTCNELLHPWLIAEYEE